MVNIVRNCVYIESVVAAQRAASLVVPKFLEIGPKRW